MLWFQLSPNTVRSRVEQGPSGRSAIWRRRRSSSPLRAEIGISVYRPTSIPRQCLCCSPETLLSYRHCHSLVLRSPQVVPTWCRLQGSKVLVVCPRYECLLCSRAATVSPRSAFVRAILPLLIIAPGENASRPFELRHCHASGQSGHKYCFVNRDHLLNIGY